MGDWPEWMWFKDSVYFVFFTDVEEDVVIFLEEFKDCKVGIQWGHQAYHNSFHCIARGWTTVATWFGPENSQEDTRTHRTRPRRGEEEKLRKFVVWSGCPCATHGLEEFASGICRGPAFGWLCPGRCKERRGDMGCASCFHVQIGADVQAEALLEISHWLHTFHIFSYLWQVYIGLPSPPFFVNSLQDRQKEKSESRREERREEVQLILSSHHCHHPKAETSRPSRRLPKQRFPLPLHRHQRWCQHLQWHLRDLQRCRSVLIWVVHVGGSTSTVDRR